MTPDPPTRAAVELEVEVPADVIQQAKQLDRGGTIEEKVFELAELKVVPEDG